MLGSFSSRDGYRLDAKNNNGSYFVQVMYASTLTSSQISIK